MALPRFMLIAVVVFAFVVVVSADSRKGRSLKPYPTPSQSPPSQDTTIVKIQGLVFCKKDGHLTPIQGATARVTCLAINQAGGYESAPFSVITPPTNDHGYFHINLGGYHLTNFKLTSCRVFLESPAPGSCNVPTDAGHGLSGALLTNYRPLSDHSALYSVGPFIYTPSQY